MAGNEGEPQPIKHKLVNFRLPKSRPDAKVSLTPNGKPCFTALRSPVVYLVGTTHTYSFPCGSLSGPAHLVWSWRHQV